MTLNKFVRFSNSPSPIYGIRPGFRISDLDPQYTSSVVVLNAVTTTTLSAAFDLGARVVSINTLFVGNGAMADIALFTSDDNFATSVASFLRVNFATGDLYVGGYAGRTGDSSNGTYQATQYGPSGAASEATSGLSTATDNNYIGGTYNPDLFLSLDGKQLKVQVQNVVGTVTVSLTPVS